MKAIQVNYRDEKINAFVHQVKKNLIFVTTSINFNVERGVKKLSNTECGKLNYSFTRSALEKLVLSQKIKISVLNQFSKIINERFCERHNRSEYHTYKEIYSQIK